MRAGRLRHRVTIQHKVTTKDEYGSTITTWEDLATVWADVLPVKGRELIAAETAAAVTTVKFVIRYRADVTATDMRIQFRGLTYNITAVLNEGTRDREMTLVTDEGLVQE